jgi:hypothetical protein
MKNWQWPLSKRCLGNSDAPLPIALAFDGMLCQQFPKSTIDPQANCLHKVGVNTELLTKMTVPILNEPRHGLVKKYIYKKVVPLGSKTQSEGSPN